MPKTYHLYRQNIWSTDKILKEIALLVCKNAKIFQLARINIDFHNVSALSVYLRLYIAPYHKHIICTDKISEVYTDKILEEI